MNIKLPNILLCLAATAALTACEEVISAGPNRYTPVQNSAVPARGVLIEEYTGTSCINCPNGHTVIEAIQEIYNTPENIEQGNEVIVVGIHIPNWGGTVDQGGLITPEAESLTPSGVTPPQASINRSSGLLNRDDWAKTVADQIVRYPAVTFPSSIAAEITNGNITISGTISPSDNVANARLHVWILEDNIIKRQKMPDGSTNREYVHNNVFRAAVTPVSGQSITLVRNQDSKFLFTYPVNTTLWNTANLRAVVFVESETDGVLNAAQAQIASPSID